MKLAIPVKGPRTAFAENGYNDFSEEMMPFIRAEKINRIPSACITFVSCAHSFHLRLSSTVMVYFLHL